MGKKNKLTKNLIYALVGAIVVYGIGITFLEDIGSQRFTFSDGEEFKPGLFATDPLNTISESWIQWDIEYSDGTTDSGRTGKNTDRFKLFSLVKSIDDPRILTGADFTVYTDFSQIGHDLCIGTPTINAQQTVYVNDVQVNVLKQLVVYNEIDERNIHKGIGTRITPEFFEGQILQNHGILRSGDVIKYVLDVNGRFDITALSPTFSCTNEFVGDGFIEGLRMEYTLVYGDPIDILLGSFPFTSDEALEAEVTVESCENGVCTETVIQEATPDPVSSTTSTNVEQTITDPDPTTSCITIYEPVCAIDGKTYSNQCLADKFNAEVIYEGTCVQDVFIENLNPTPIDDGTPTGVDGIVGICDPNVINCEENSPDIQEFVDQIRQEEFKFNSFEFIMLMTIGIIIVVIIASRIVGPKR